MKKIFLLSISIVLIIPIAVSAYTYGGVKWSGNGTTVDTGDASLPWGWISPIAASMSSWNNTGANFTFSVGSGHELKVGYTSPSNAAETTIWYSGSTITDILTTFNDDLNWTTSGEANKYDVQNVTTHELGHWLMLADLSGGGDTEKTMYYLTDEGETKKRSLHSDDIAGINYIYP